MTGNGSGWVEIEVHLPPELADLVRAYARVSDQTPEAVIAKAVHAYLVKRKGRLDP